MQEALYHPEFGYYTRNIRAVGREGDFSTWPTLEGGPAAAIARWLGKSRHVIEIGAGSGQLARGILKARGLLSRFTGTYHIVEVSPTLRARQQALLRGPGVRWHESVAAALEAAGGEADLFSNELVDAFPCRIFVRSGGNWRELAVRVAGGAAREELTDTELPDSTAFRSDAAEGDRVEVHASYRDWMAGWLPAWTKGRLLTIDYGSTMPDLYHRRPGGTVRAYSHQQRRTGAEVYAAFGRRDLTADVNFSDLEKWGAEDGLMNIRLETLGDFLNRFGTPVPAGYEGAGEAFLALEQRRGR
jgi:SAM-dependent MidA family methyltransferase